MCTIYKNIVKKIILDISMKQIMHILNIFAYVQYVDRILEKYVGYQRIVREERIEC